MLIIFQEDRIINSIELGIRVWLMLYLGNAGFNGDPGALSHQWTRGISPNQILIESFPYTSKAEEYEIRTNLFEGRIIKSSESSEPGKDLIFSDLFNLWDMQRLAGFEIVWTDNLLDHLLVQKFRTTVFVFHHAAVLQELRAG